MSKSMYCKSNLGTFGTMDSIPVKIPCEPHFHDLLKQNTDSHVTQDSNTFRELVGSLIYLKVRLSPLACFAVTDRGDAHKRSRKSTRLYVLLTYQQALSFIGHTIKSIILWIHKTTFTGKIPLKILSTSCYINTKRLPW